MPPKTRKVQKNKETAKVPLTIGSKSTQDGAPSLRTELSSGLEEIHLGPREIWFKYGDVQPTRVVFEGIVDDLKGEIKEKLPNQLGDVDVNQITLKMHGEETDLRADFIIDQKFLTTYDTPLQVIVNSPVIKELKHEINEINDTIKTVFAQQKSPDRVSVSNLSEMRMGKILNNIGVKQITFVKEDFEKLNPISHPPFEWSEETEAQQMDEVVKWFDDALKLPRGLNVWDIHTDVNYQREIRSAKVLLTGGGDIAIGPSRTDCVWVGAKKSMAECKIALAIIKHFVIEEGNRLNNWIGKSATYISEDTIEPFRKKAKLTEDITGESDERMELMIDDMSEEELLKMNARKKLKIVRRFCKLDEQPYIDQIIKVVFIRKEVRRGGNVGNMVKIRDGQNDYWKHGTQEFSTN
ncbi:1687_t:CDS:2, partial [Racocetra fulgida]